MKNIAFSSIKELKQGLECKEFSSKELLGYFIERFKQYDSALGSALEIFEANQVEHSDQGILQGIPGLIKDNICISGHSVSCASKILQNFVAPYDATVIKKLRNAGATFIGRANMDEFAMGSSTETSAYKKTQNPWDSSRVPGGSSGGSAAAVAAGLIPWSLGSDTGGSIRQPAAFCGIVGMKPTYGLVSRYGLVAYASSLDQIGPMTRTVYDNALILSLIAGNDEHDSSTRPGQAVDYTKNLTGNLKAGLRIGIVDNALHAQGMDSEIGAALEQVIKNYETLGATIKHITISAMDYSAAAYFVLSRAEAASNLARFDGVRYGLRAKNSGTLSELYTNTRHDGFGKEVRARIMIGNYVLSAGYANEFYVNAKKVQALMRTQFMQAFNDVDILLMPTHPMPAFKFGAFDVDTLQMDLQDYFTCSMNLAGIPAISLPCGFTKTKLPIGFQLAANHGREDLLYQTAYAYEQKNSWHTMHPANF